MNSEQHKEPEYLLRVKEVLERVKISRSAWYDGVKKGRFPQPVRLGPRMTLWKNSDIQKLTENGLDSSEISGPH